MEKDELISGSELASRLKLSPAYVSSQKKAGKLKGCTYGKKYYFRKSAQALGKDPDNPYETKQKTAQSKNKLPKGNENWDVYTPEDGMKILKEREDKEKKQPKKQSNQKIEDINEDDLEDIEAEAEELLSQILEAVKDKNNNRDRALLDGLKAKASIINEYFKAENEKIKNKQLKENLFEKDEVIKILGYAGNAIRNALVNLPNNYAVNLEGMTQKQIKDYVEKDIDKILSELNKTAEQFN